MAVAIEEVIRVAERVRLVDDCRPGEDPFKLPDALRSEIEAEYRALLSLGGAHVLTDEERACHSQRYRLALEDLRERLKEGYYYIQSRPGYELDAAQRQKVFTAYGWEEGKRESLKRDETVIALGYQSQTASQSAQPLYARYPAGLQLRINIALTTISATHPLARVGRRQSMTRQRSQTARKLWVALTRARFHYCAASPLLDKTPELAAIGFSTPRKSPRVAGDSLRAAEVVGWRTTE